MNRKKQFVKKPSTVQNKTEFTLSNEYKSLICSQSYLGKKGYTIPKSILSKEDDEFIRKDLFVKPMIIGVNYGGADGENTAFPVFRENTNKIYIPRFYGIQRYGSPFRNEIEPGDDIDVPFAKPLRDYQEQIIDKYIKHVQKPIVNGSTENGSTDNGCGGVLEVPCGRGKCLGKDTPILMYDGTIKLVQDIIVGDLLMGDDSTPRNVLTLARGREIMYKVSDATNNYYIVNESHILSLKSESDNIVDINLFDYYEKKGYQNNELMGYRVPIKFQKKTFKYNPYIVGFNLLKSDAPLIPNEYKCNSVDIQMQLLTGILNSTDTLDNYVYSTNQSLIDDITYIARSIGLCVHTSPNSVQIGKSGEHISVQFKNINNNNLKYQIKVEKLEVDDYYGFEINGNRRFVLGDFTVTHNTVMGLKIISILKKKTLILVHKEFLMNQWIERISEFLPTAKVGKIQGPTFDINQKDIVIGMIQTLYDKEYSTDAFSSFGLTIVDEVHRIGSEQFSRTLFKTITPYMLGISATVERKDKLTRILYMFIGEKIYSEERKDEDPVCVRAINYVCNDSEFNEVEMDYRGNPKYSTMITKLCAYGPRSDFIVRVIGDLIIEEPENQIMILCHNRSMLKYLYDAVQHRGFATVGYYVGGMKQTNLQETETKQIVLATYAMAAEALDIKSLSTLVMVTPKTDIIQSVGRILRVKHDNPRIVDIVDSHSIFQNQWTQRRRFYKKCNYRIRQIESRQYTGMNIDWTADQTWKRVFEPKLQMTSASASASASALNNDSDGEDNDQVDLKNRKCLIDIDSMA